jgi:hypothetical protein
MGVATLFFVINQTLYGTNCPSFGDYSRTGEWQPIENQHGDGDYALCIQQSPENVSPTEGFNRASHE